MTTSPVTLADLAHDLLTTTRAAGHPVVTTGPGRWNTTDHPTTLPTDAELAPNDLLDAAREAARARVAWVHAVLPTAVDAVQLAATFHSATRPPVPQQAPIGRRGPWRTLLRRPVGRAVGGDPRRVPFAVLVDQMPTGVVTLTEHRAGRAVHVVEIPAAWLTARSTR